MLDSICTEWSLLPPYHTCRDILLFSFPVEFSISNLSSVDLESWFGVAKTQYDCGPSIVFSKFGSNYSHPFASRFRSGRDHPSFSPTWAWVPQLGCSWIWKVSGKASLMVSISAIARAMIYYTGELNSQACIGNSCHEILSCKICVNHLPPQARIYLCPGPPYIFHKICFWYG